MRDHRSHTCGVGWKLSSHPVSAASVTLRIVRAFYAEFNRQSIKHARTDGRLDMTLHSVKTHLSVSRMETWLPLVG